MDQNTYQDYNNELYHSDVIAHLMFILEKLRMAKIIINNSDYNQDKFPVYYSIMMNNMEFKIVCNIDGFELLEENNITDFIHRMIKLNKK